MAKYKQKDKEAYLSYYKSKKAKRQKPLTFSQWLGAKKTKGSKQTKKSMTSLSSGDYNELMKRFGKGG